MPACMRRAPAIVGRVQMFHQVRRNRIDDVLVAFRIQRIHRDVKLQKNLARLLLLGLSARLSLGGLVVAAGCRGAVGSSAEVPGLSEHRVCPRTY